MPRISDIAILHTPQQPTLHIRATTVVDKLPELIGDGYRRMSEYLAQNDECLADIPFVRFIQIGLDTPDIKSVDIEIGFPIARFIKGEGDIEAGIIPEQKTLYCMYLGAYSEIGPVYQEMIRWASERGLRPTGDSYEYYCNGPDVPPEQLLTKVLLPLK